MRVRWLAFFFVIVLDWVVQDSGQLREHSAFCHLSSDWTVVCFWCSVDSYSPGTVIVWIVPALPAFVGFSIFVCFVCPRERWFFFHLVSWLFSCGIIYVTRKNHRVESVAHVFVLIFSVYHRSKCPPPFRSFRRVHSFALQNSKREGRFVFCCFLICVSLSWIVNEKTHTNFT